MSLTQVALLKKAELPTKTQIEKCINELGYKFEIHDNLEVLKDIDSLECTINGHKTFFEIFYSQPDELIKDHGFIKKDLDDQDFVLWFVWGANYAAGASIGLISVALIELCNALVYYLDDEMPYSKEMLIADTPQFLEELEKENAISTHHESQVSPKSTTNNGLWSKIKNLFN